MRQSQTPFLFYSAFKILGYAYHKPSLPPLLQKLHQYISYNLTENKMENALMNDNKLKILIKDMLLQGANPEKIAMSITLGGILGIFPIPGLSTPMCALTAISLRLNHAVIQAVNYAASPFQFLLLGGYITLGNRWFGGSSSIESLKSIADLMTNDFWSGLLALKQFGFYAVSVWLVTSPLLAVAAYFLTKFVAVKVKDALNYAKVGAFAIEKSKIAQDPKPANCNQCQIGLPCETC